MIRLLAESDQLGRLGGKPGIIIEGFLLLARVRLVAPLTDTGSLLCRYATWTQYVWRKTWTHIADSRQCRWLQRSGMLQWHNSKPAPWLIRSQWPLQPWQCRCVGLWEEREAACDIRKAETIRFNGSIGLDRQDSQSSVMVDDQPVGGHT